MMLLFYSYYKQATLGPCTLAKPAFWDVVNKAKWNAWTSLGQMSKDQAMKKYVEEIKKVYQNKKLNCHLISRVRYIPTYSNWM